MLEGLTEEETDTFLQENPTLVPLYEIDVVKEAEPYQFSEEAAIVELGRTREALERELAVSQRVRPTELEEFDLGTTEEPHNVLIAKELELGLQRVIDPCSPDVQRRIRVVIRGHEGIKSRILSS
jgi:hypothetical protein